MRRIQRWSCNRQCERIGQLAGRQLMASATARVAARFQDGPRWPAKAAGSAAADRACRGTDQCALGAGAEPSAFEWAVPAQPARAWDIRWIVLE